MPISGAHIFGWDEAPTDEKLEALYDWCILLTDALRAAGEETQTLLARVKKLEGEASVRTGVSIAAPETHKEVANSNALEESSAPPTLSPPITLGEPQRNSAFAQPSLNLHNESNRLQ
jgi:hypothetical protein